MRQHIPIEVQIIRKPSQVNKVLLDNISQLLPKLVPAGYIIQVRFINSNGKIKCPRIQFKQNEYVGNNQIFGLLSQLTQKSSNYVESFENDPLERRWQEKAMYTNDESDNESFTGIDEQSLQDKMKSFHAARKGRNGYNNNNDSDTDEERPTIKKPKKKKKKSKTRPQYNDNIQTDSSSHSNSKKSKREGKLTNIREQASDYDIGGSFAEMSGGQDNILLENMFANQQETPI